MGDAMYVRGIRISHTTKLYTYPDVQTHIQIKHTNMSHTYLDIINKHLDIRDDIWKTCLDINSHSNTTLSMLHHYEETWGDQNPTDMKQHLR